MVALPYLEALEHLRKDITNQVGIRFDSPTLLIPGLILLGLAYVFMPSAVVFALSLALFLSPLWLPILLVGGAWKLWYVFKRSQFIAAQQYVLLEIKPPRNLVKTPLAMEAFFSAIHLTGGESTWYARFKGGIRPFYSLEIASFEGQIHFFMWGRANMRKIIEGQMYAQYPGVQIVEALDYSRLISAKPGEWGVWGCDFANTNENPLPIKTYVEYALDQVQKEPEQVDPLSNLIEFMGSIGKGENIWLQFVIRAHQGERYGAGPGSKESTKKNAEGKVYTWRDKGKELIEEIRKKARNPYIDPVTGEERPGFPNPTKGESELMGAIDRNTTKLAYDVGIRGVYLAKPNKFNVSAVTHMVGLFKPFTNTGWNGINSTKWMKRFDDYPWEIGVEKRKNHYREKLVEHYRRRQFFYDPFFHDGLFGDETMILSTEELATVFHIPSQSIQSPGLARVSSATGESPPNLPT
ncbi:hypothetical protein A2118_01115 [Candidatus Kaiserbacteria bacterium GWA2_50_9]|uniref:DUF8128 domain-containing protein n=1 Tax=Candidatus Kaiserbacteria bacterium GWA2_50_9 TaxID=1798474 RepID=A0A1F6BSL9_9BACT|nr:MAG: hypothetical protein A2118_01115 [Candidatus Kaiserbacteria bacterium GWA2_50_9]